MLMVKDYTWLVLRTTFLLPVTEIFISLYTQVINTAIAIALITTCSLFVTFSTAGLKYKICLMLTCSFGRILIYRSETRSHIEYRRRPEIGHALWNWIANRDRCRMHNAIANTDPFLTTNTHQKKNMSSQISVSTVTNDSVQNVLPLISERSRFLAICYGLCVSISVEGVIWWWLVSLDNEWWSLRTSGQNGWMPRAKWADAERVSPIFLVVVWVEMA